MRTTDFREELNFPLSLDFSPEVRKVYAGDVQFGLNGVAGDVISEISAGWLRSVGPIIIGGS